ncbi:hypothetical protein HNR77_004858 [Paenibacillus sp. JGP012]|nr:hypothetical protein [Paenibacillus sp. JGP012]
MCLPGFFLFIMGLLTYHSCHSFIQATTQFKAPYITLHYITLHYFTLPYLDPIQLNSVQSAEPAQSAQLLIYSNDSWKRYFALFRTLFFLTIRRDVNSLHSSIYSVFCGFRVK